MSDPVSRAVRLLNSIHASIRDGATSISKMKSAALSKQHFPKFAVGSLVVTGVAGCICFQQVSRRMPSTENLNYVPEKMSQEEALVRAMVKNAKESSVQENLSNAAQAQKRFVLPGRINEEPPEFLNKIVKRRDEMLVEQEQKQKQQQEEHAFNHNEKFGIDKVE